MKEHLSIERISILLDEPWADLEAQAHLEGCDDCRAEFEGLSRMRMAMSALGELEPPSGHWEAIEAALDDNGAQASVRPLRRFAQKLMVSGPLQAAAALTLFAGGVVAGLQLTGEETGLLDTTAAPPAVISQSGDDRMMFDGLTQIESLGAPLRQVGIGGDAGPTDGDPFDGITDGLAAAEAALRLEALITAMRERLDRDPSDQVASAYLVRFVEERALLAERLERSFQARGSVTW